MSFRCWMLSLAAVMASGQATEPFQPERIEPWKPAWELTLRSDQLADPGDPSDRFHRLGLQVRLRWTWESEALKLVGGTRSALGSDGNQFNALRWDQQPSNGSQVDEARAELSWVREKAFGTLNLGFQENGLVSSQAIWDRDLRLLGLGGRLGFRSPGGLVQEAGIRVVAGRVRDVLAGKIDVAAGQVILKLDTGPLSWLAHAGRWQLSWAPGDERLRRLPGADPAKRQEIRLDACGASGTWHAIVPLEARWFWSKNRASGKTSEEAQGTVGGRERVYWPQLSFTWQRLSSTGTLYPVNGDEWWFYRRTRGPRFDLSVPLPGRWIASAVFLRQRAEGEYYQVTRRMIVLMKRF